MNYEKNPLLPFRWGVGRLIMESRRLPVVIPIYHIGTRIVSLLIFYTQLVFKKKTRDGQDHAREIKVSPFRQEIDGCNR